MSFRVRVEAFEGPFDLLLRLVSRQRIDIGAISIAQIADQYLDEVEHMKDLDLDVASDFLVVAATLLQIKAASLVPDEGTPDLELDDEFSDFSPEETRDILVERLVTYKQFKNAAAALGSRLENEGHMHPRQAGLEPQFLNLMPDYLKDVTLHELAVICADLAARRDTFLLEAEHIAAVPISMEQHVEGIYRTMKRRKSRTFNQLVGDNPTPELVVVTFLAVLELYKRGVVSLEQDDAFEDISLKMEDSAPEITDFSVPDWGMPEDPTLEQEDGAVVLETDEELARAEEQEGARKDGADAAGHDGQATQAAADGEAENRQPEEQE